MANDPVRTSSAEGVDTPQHVLAGFARASYHVCNATVGLIAAQWIDRSVRQRQRMRLCPSERRSVWKGPGE